MLNYNSTLQSNNTDLQAILNTINELPEVVEQATPVISVSSNGLITATAGTKSATKQLAFQAAKTITPNTVNQIAVSSGYYTGGNITVAGDSNLVPSNIVSGKSIFGVVGTATTGDDPFAGISPFTYTVSDISGASYGFTKNSNGYYESQNKGQNNSYAICRVNLTVTSTCDIVFDVINYAESNYDYALFGNLNSALALSSSADSSVKKNFKGQQSASVINVTYSGVTAGNHYIDIKFIKDTSQHSNNDSVQFKLQEQKGGLSQETINKILAADTDLVSGNIKSGVDIFGVTGTYGGAGGNTDVEDGLIDGTITSITNDRVENIRNYAFNYCSRLTTVNCPACTTIGSSVFNYCSGLTTVNFPACTTIGSYAFHSCSSLTSVSFPACTTIGSYAFNNCSSLTSVSFPACTTIGSYAFRYCFSLTSANFSAYTNISGYAFYNCYNLKSLYLTGSSLCTLLKSNAFYSTPIDGYSASAGTYGSIYVPASLLTSYKNATNWTYFSSRFVGIDTDLYLIEFTIAGTPYQAEENMSWGEWIRSAYNTSGYYSPDYHNIRDANGNAVRDAYYTDIIIPNTDYLKFNTEPT